MNIGVTFLMEQWNGTEITVAQISFHSEYLESFFAETLERNELTIAKISSWSMNIGATFLMEQWNGT